MEKAQLKCSCGTEFVPVDPFIESSEVDEICVGVVCPACMSEHYAYIKPAQFEEGA